MFAETSKKVKKKRKKERERDNLNKVLKDVIKQTPIIFIPSNRPFSHLAILEKVTTIEQEQQ